MMKNGGRRPGDIHHTLMFGRKHGRNHANFSNLIRQRNKATHLKCCLMEEETQKCAWLLGRTETGRMY